MLVTEADAYHFLGRIGFAPLPSDVNHVVGRDQADVVDEILNLNRDLPATPDRLLVADRMNFQANSQNLGWWLNRMIQSRITGATPSTPDPLLEKLTMFWHGHFATEFPGVDDALLMFEQNQILRAGAFGDFAQLCTDISLHGAMLIYLNNESNVQGFEQENFARELMELFTMGVGNFTENDVVEMARAWTGHGIIGYDPALGGRNGTYQFYPDLHDDGQKTIFGINANWDGPDTITEIVRGVRQQATANFISTKLWRFFINGAPPPGAIEQLAAAFIAADMTIKPLMRALLLRPEFWAPENRRALVKTPSQYAVDLYRCISLLFVDTEAPYFLAPMGQVLFDPPNVAGWGTNGYWLSTATMWGRAKFAANRRWAVANEDSDFLQELRDMDPATGTAHLLQTFRLHEVSAATTNAIESWFASTKEATPWALAPVGISVTALSPEFQVI